MITLKNWNKQQPEVVYFVQTDYQGDEFEVKCQKNNGIKLLQSIQTVKFTRL